MAIIKKKIVVKRKAKDGDEVRTVERGELSDVKKRETGMERLKKFYGADYLKADSAKTGAGKVLRKAGNTVLKAAFTPHALMETAMRAGETAKNNKKDLAEKKMGGKVAKKMAPKMMMKKMSKKK